MKMKRYYVGSRDIGRSIQYGKNAACTMNTPEEAISEATRKIQNNEGDCYVIVKIVAVVKKDNPPVKVTFVPAGFELEDNESFCD